MNPRIVLTVALSASLTVFAGWLAHPAIATDCGANPGPDVIVGDLPAVANYSSLGGIEAFSIATTSCNVGTDLLAWVSNTNQHPVIAQNMFRLNNGRFEQVGQSWLKHGFFALQQELCCDCNPAGSGSNLGVGCSDPYSASRNGGQSGLGPKHEVNASSGAFPYPYGDGNGQNTSIYKRLQVKISDLDPTQDGGGMYFIEGHYVAPDDAAFGNQDNNASYRQIGISGSGASWSASLSGMPPTQREMPGIRAWQDHDPSVVETDIGIPGDGLVILAATSIDLGGGWYRYEYAVQNLNSDRSIGSFSIPVGPGDAVTNIGFHDVDYHSGEPYDGTDWSGLADGSAVTWSTTSHAANPDANALRWGTLYNFRFDSTAAPTTVTATLGLFKPGTPSSVTASTVGPQIGAPATGGCCAGGACTIETSGDCATLGGSWLGAGTDCAGDPCSGAGCPSGEVEDCFGNCAPASWIGDGICDDGARSWNGVPIYLNCSEHGNDGGDCDTVNDVVRVASADFATDEGTIESGSFLDTHVQDDVRQVLRERHTGGKPSNRRSLLSHTWTFDVASGSGFSFHVDAHHDFNTEDDHFVFSYSRDDIVYTPMVTVTKTADDDALQSFDFTEDVSGLLYVRVEDTDRTPGNRGTDALHVDEMFIVTAVGGSDTTPPPAPGVLQASSGDGIVTLTWDDVPASDLDGYLVYRASTSGGPYTALTPAPIATSTYDDTAVMNGTTYYYVVSAVDVAGNESAVSNEAPATPQAPGGGATTMHVANIDLSVQNAGGGRKRGRAHVTVLDDQGAPVVGAEVFGLFVGDVNGAIIATTDVSGIAELTTFESAQGNPHFTFCVDGVVHPSLNYASGENLETCDVR